VNQSQHELDRYAAIVDESAAIKGVSLGKDAWRRLRRKPVAIGSLLLLVLLSILAFLTPVLPLQAPRTIHTKLAFEPPSFANAFVDTQNVDTNYGDLNWFNAAMVRARLSMFRSSDEPEKAWAMPSICGRDELGRDVLARLFWGARISLIVGLVATLVSLVIGVSYGAISGYCGGAIDNVMMRIVDVLYSIPFIFVVIYLVTILGEPSIRTYLESIGIDRITIFFLVVGAIYWLTMARVVRGQVISLKNDQFVEAARTIGASQFRIIFRHLVPNLLSIVIVYLTLTIPRVMLFEAFLSFLGLGVEPPNVSWGLLANQGFIVITPIKIFWWLIVFPGLALGTTLFALNFLGDGLRDALDPRMKNK
jgi:oligopeptide transport system permease protein